ncbi:MAG TPA: hypothetical protein PK609_02335 [Candidatus Paceibacterota bacterium]|nr:hypothetical protein [Candidatus Paceibacterota bacterium]
MTCPRLLAVILAVAVLAPVSASAATFASARTLVISEATAENAYLAGTDVTVAAPVTGDVLGAGGTMTIAAPVEGDTLLIGGSVSVDRAVSGDVRAAGGRVSVNAPITGDLVIAGGSVTASSTAAETRIIGGTVAVNGSGGKAVIYGAEVHLSGIFGADVEVIATDRLTLADGTIIKGSLKYDAPQEALIPATASVTNGVLYTGNSSYLPTVEEAQTFAIAGAGVFLIVRILAVLIGAALLAGLFPVFSQTVTDKVLAPSVGRFVVLALLGFAVVFAAPVFIFILLVSFVGMVVAIVLLLAYLLLLILGYLYAGVIAGSALGRGLLKRTRVTWKLALLGMLVLYLVSAVPILGGLIVFVLFLAATGGIVAIAYRYVFRRLAENSNESLV